MDKAGPQNVDVDAKKGPDSLQRSIANNSWFIGGDGLEFKLA